MLDQKGLLAALTQAEKETRVIFNSSNEVSHLTIVDSNDGTYKASLAGMILIGVLGLEKALEHLKESKDSGIAFIREKFEISEVGYVMGIVLATDFKKAKSDLENGTLFAI